MRYKDGVELFIPITYFKLQFFFLKADEMDIANLAHLERLRNNQRQDYLKGSVSGSLQATDRLMKELRDIYRSDTFKKGLQQFILLNFITFTVLNICISHVLIHHCCSERFFPK